MKYLIIVLFLGLSFYSNAQDVTINDSIYNVRGDVITKDGVDVTEALSEENMQKIRATLKEKIANDEAVREFEKVNKKQEKEQKNTENELKKAKKKQKQAEKALSRKQKAQKKLKKYKKKYLKAQNRYERLKKIGKLSPEDEVKWFNKIEKLNKSVIKAEKKI